MYNLQNIFRSKDFTVINEPQSLNGHFSSAMFGLVNS